MVQLTHPVLDHVPLPFSPSLSPATEGLESGSEKHLPLRSAAWACGDLAIWFGYIFVFGVVNFWVWLPHW